MRNEQPRLLTSGLKIRLGAAIGGGAALAMLTGCAVADLPLWSGAKTELFRPSNFVSAGPVPAQIRRVGVLPMHSDQWSPADIHAVEKAFASELGKTGRFEVIEIARADMKARFGQDAVSSTAALPAELLPYLAEQFGLQAVLFVDLTQFTPYQPLVMGVRAKLAPVQGAGVFWSFDCVFDAALPEVANAARQYHRTESPPAYPDEDTGGILLSPARFAKYVAWATFDTIPSRHNE